MLTSVNKKNLHRFVDSSVFLRVERAAHHHSGIADVSLKLTNFCGKYLSFHSSNFLDKLLLEALAIWQANILSVGINEAYKAFCQHILSQLPSILDYTVVGQSKIHPSQRLTWDCFHQGFYDWVVSSNVNPETLQINYAPATHFLSREIRGYLLAHHVFSRSDFQHLGLASEQHAHLPHLIGVNML